ncbi:MAG: Gfo/Idh/MocA family oxidoreductase [Deltaproteobacteria bacterium]|nr:Gfo/Idh/MocA family oxidoreductase [Deltaproteobacteria bacterium]
MKPRKRIKTAVVGVGYLGRLHAQKYAALEGAQFVGVYDSDPARADTVAAEFNTKAFHDMKDLFGQVEAVSVVTPTEHHFRLGMEFLSRGVHVMMEKPITATTEEARSLVAEAKRTGAVLQVGHLERFNGAMAALGNRIKNPTYIEAFRLSPFPNRSTDVDVVLDLMIHDIDLVLSMAASEPVSVEAVGIPVVMPGKADFANARVTFRNGCVASLTASRVSKERARKINVFQPGAVISIDYGAQGLTVTNTIAGAPGGLNAQVDEDIAVEKKDAILEELKSFLDSIMTGRPPAVSGEDGLRALELAERVQKAFMGGRA